MIDLRKTFEELLSYTQSNMDVSFKVQENVNKKLIEQILRAQKISPEIILSSDSNPRYLTLNQLGKVIGVLHDRKEFKEIYDEKLTKYHELTSLGKKTGIRGFCNMEYLGHVENWSQGKGILVPIFSGVPFIYEEDVIRPEIKKRFIPEISYEKPILFH